ncbi:porin family protein [Spirosoma validum]|uniref:PorT family protein n=1 Tax=Spirosoma validum TaxID=2771355 RepID=A0A927AY11_9BACT|nr:hypothetical protein [Spirosoma validum]MBD2751845.1 hypothetical protein [Spirosoma validum]
MKIRLLFFILFLTVQLALGQTTRSDVLHKLDRQTVNVKIDELTDTEVIYFEPTAPKAKKKIARSQVWKIVFSDGSTEVLTPLPDGVSTTSKVDQITLIDQTVVQGKVSRRDDRKLYYTKPETPDGPQYELLLSRLDHIRYADGKEETFRKAVGSTPSVGISSAPSAPASQPDRSTEKEPKSQLTEYSAPSASARYSNAFGRLQATIGPEFAYYPDPVNKDRAWLNDSTGFGMKQNIGASLRVDYRLLKPLAISITAGYFGWELVRRYTREGVDEYTETKRLTQIPVQLGVKIYPAGGFYIMPEAGATFLFASVKTSDMHPIPADESAKSTPITYGASLGYEIRSKALLFDLSLRYQLLNVNNLNYAAFNQSLSEQVNIASIRLGIGFNAIKK